MISLNIKQPMYVYVCRDKNMWKKSNQTSINGGLE